MIEQYEETEARDDLFALLDRIEADDSLIDALIEHMMSDKLDGKFYWLDDCGCIKGKIFSYLDPDFAKRFNAIGVTRIDIEDFMPKLRACASSPIEEYISVLTRLNREMAFYVTIRDNVVRWLNEWRASQNKGD